MRTVLNLRAFWVVLVFGLLCAVPSGANAYVRSTLGAGNLSACALTADKSVMCWGSDYFGQLGDGGVLGEQESYLPTKVLGIDDAVEVDVASSTACARVTGGRIKCWGDGFEGQLGNGAAKGSAEPVEVKGLAGVRQLRMGGDQGCVVLESRQVSCWGNPRTQSGSSVRRTPKRIPGISGVRELAVGFYGACAIVGGGRVKCWGLNADDWVPVGGGKYSSRPSFVKSLTNARSVALADYSACATKTSGAVFCWGSPLTTRKRPAGYDYSVPRRVSGLKLEELIAGDYHVCGSDAKGSVVCWGDGDEGQVGSGRRRSWQGPTKVKGVSRISAFTGGFQSTCVMLPKFVVKCWGASYLDPQSKDRDMAPTTIIG